MAEFISTHQDKVYLRSLFCREVEGMYSFGTKKINVKCEDNCLKVRVGGGYVSIEEYVDLNMPYEIAKMNNDGLLSKAYL
jgi:hypothetical protein